MPPPGDRPSLAVTGAGGLLGAHLARAALARGFAVRALLRRPGPKPSLSGLPIEIHVADLAEEAPPAAFLAGACAVVHAAAYYAEGEAQRAALFRTNLDGTLRILEAATHAGVQRLVHVSTMGTCIPHGLARPATERDRAGPDATPYVLSKLAAEDAALAAGALAPVVVNPSALVGAFDGGRTVTGRRLLAVREGRVPSLPEAGLNLVPATAVARTILQALDRGRSGERYLLGGENLDPEAFLARAAAAAGVPVPSRGLADWLRGRGRPLPGGLLVDDAKARAELGHEPGDLDQALREAYAS
jgi:dihydroflavonol-4-reductase